MRIENIQSGAENYTSNTTNVPSRTDSVKNNSQEKIDITNNKVTIQETIKKEVNEHEVIQAIEKANKHIKTYDRRLEFSIHETTKQIMVKVINTDNDTVIREIPSEKILDMVAHLWEVAGILVDEKR